MIRDFWLIIVLVFTFSLLGATSVRANEIVNEDKSSNEDIILKEQEETKDSEITKPDEVNKESQTGKVIVQYLDINGNRLHDDYEEEGPLGEPYEVFSIDIKDYALKEIKGLTYGTYNEEDTLITFIYSLDTTTDIDEKEYVEVKEVEEDEDFDDPSEEYETDGVLLSMGSFYDAQYVPYDIENPDTGDNIYFYFVLCFTSILFIGGLIIIKRKLAC